MKKIKKGDEVIVIAGKDKGKKGIVKKVLCHGRSLLVEGINMVKKHQKPNPQANRQGGIETISMPIDASNVMLYDPNANKGSRVGIRVLEDGSRARYFKVSNQVVDMKV